MADMVEFQCPECNKKTKQLTTVASVWCGNTVRHRRSKKVEMRRKKAADRVTQIALDAGLDD